jgi:hypothetical protein
MKTIKIYLFSILFCAFTPVFAQKDCFSYKTISEGGEKELSFPVFSQNTFSEEVRDTVLRLLVYNLGDTTRNKKITIWKNNGKILKTVHIGNKAICVARQINNDLFDEFVKSGIGSKKERKAVNKRRKALKKIHIWMNPLDDRYKLIVKNGEKSFYDDLDTFMCGIFKERFNFIEKVLQEMEEK